MNARISAGGFSPLQRVFGCQPPVPGYIAHESPTLMSGASAGDPDFGHTLALRRAAWDAVQIEDGRHAIGRASAVRPRAIRELTAGDHVRYWRRGVNMMTRRKPNREYWHGPSRLLLKEGTGLLLALALRAHHRLPRFAAQARH